MYIKVEWIHEFPNEPIVIYSQLDDKYNEVRKIEIYKDGTYGYANYEKEIGETKLSIEPIPPIAEIALDKQFKPMVITMKEFEEIWNKIVQEQL